MTLRHILMHSAGLPGLPAELTVEELCDWERMCDLIAGAELWWAPGAGFGYHALTFGFLLGELIRRATGRSISAQLRERITTPLGVADEVLFAVPERLLDRVASQQPTPDRLPEPPEGSPLARALPAAVRPTADYANRCDVLGAEIPSAGTMSPAARPGCMPRCSARWTGSSWSPTRGSPRSPPRPSAAATR